MLVIDLLLIIKQTKNAEREKEREERAKANNEMSNSK